MSIAISAVMSCTDSAVVFAARDPSASVICVEQWKAAHITMHMPSTLELAPACSVSDSFASDAKLAQRRVTTKPLTFGLRI
jgi:hypothetical protein